MLYAYFLHSARQETGKPARCPHGNRRVPAGIRRQTGGKMKHNLGKRPKKAWKNNSFLQKAVEITKMQRTSKHAAHKENRKFFLFAKKLTEDISFHKKINRSYIFSQNLKIFIAFYTAANYNIRYKWRTVSIGAQPPECKKYRSCGR